jgi:CubicO group peptidase (beta-lactamase class C family)
VTHTHRLLIGLLVVFSAFACQQKNKIKTEEIAKIVLPKPEPLQESQATLNTWKTAIEERYDGLHRGGFNGCVLVARKGVVIFEKCYGVQDDISKNALTPNTSFQLASTSKTFTSMAIVYLWQQGKLSPNDSLKKYFPELPYTGITVSDLLSHRSGLPNYIHFTEKPWKDSTSLMSNKDLLEYMVKEKPEIQTRPGHFAYNNTNYALLALIIEKVSGKSYSDFLEQSFFIPLGMKNTFVFSDQLPLPKQNVTTGYLRRNTPDEMVPADGIVGDKNIYSSIEDMLIWDRALSSGLIFKDKYLKEAFAPRSFERPGQRNYGYGWRLTQKPEGDWFVYHNGWWHGYNSAFYRNPSDQTTVIVLSNKFNRNVYKVQQVWDILYGTAAGNGLDEE